MEKDVPLFKYYTMRAHCTASVMFSQDNTEALIEEILRCNGDCCFLGGCSNILFADHVEKLIINLMALNNNLTLNKEGTFTVGCFVSIQRFINYGKDNAIGGFEYLYFSSARVGAIVHERLKIRDYSSNLHIAEPVRDGRAAA